LAVYLKVLNKYCNLIDSIERRIQIGAKYGCHESVIEVGSCCLLSTLLGRDLFSITLSVLLIILLIILYMICFVNLVVCCSMKQLVDEYADADEPARSSTTDSVSEAAERRVSGMVLRSQHSSGFCTYHSQKVCNIPAAALCGLLTFAPRAHICTSCTLCISPFSVSVLLYRFIYRVSCMFFLTELRFISTNWIDECVTNYNNNNNN